MIYPKSYLVWDLETSGLDPMVNKIIEIGALAVVGGEVVGEWSWLLNHDIQVSSEIERITGITNDMIKADGIRPVDAIDSFLAVFNQYGLGANLTHNGIRFDLDFLFRAMVDREIYPKIILGCIDTAAMYKGKTMGIDRQWNESFYTWGSRVLNTKAFGVKYNVKHCCEQLGVDLKDAEMHRALGDCRLTNEIYKKLTNQQPRDIAGGGPGGNSQSGGGDGSKVVGVPSIIKNVNIIK